MQVAGSNSTRFGFSRTLFPRTSSPHSRMPSSIRFARSSEYDEALTTATDEDRLGPFWRGLSPGPPPYPARQRAPAPRKKLRHLVFTPRLRAQRVGGLRLS